MIIDHLSNANRYSSLSEKIKAALQFLQSTGLRSFAKGRHEIDGESIFAIVNEYETTDVSNEQMESHKKYIDVQYMIDGEELIGHSFLQEQVPSKAYSDEDDYMLFSGTPSFFSAFQKGMFAIFYPTDLHMPGIAKGQASIVKKAVIKVRID